MSALANRDFVKMNGLGNEIVIVDLRRAPGGQIGAADARAAARQEPYDQFMALYPARGVEDASIRIFNNDGSEAGACGNGMRCVAALIGEETGRAELKFATAAGLITCRRENDGMVTVDMGRPRLRWDEIPLAQEFADTRAIELEIGPRGAPILHSPSAVSMGNPHAIFWVDDPAAYDLAKIGPLLEHDPMFPERANITLAATPSRSRIAIRTWERGAGLTKACGSAACAAAVAAARLKRTGRKVTAAPPGGELSDRMARERRPRADDRPGRFRAQRPVRCRAVCRRGRGSGVTMSVDVVTFGCRLNAAESEVIRREAERAGFTDTVVVNTCAVTAEAVRQARQAIRALRRDRPRAKIVVTGCAAQTEPATFAAMAETDRVIGNAEKLSAAGWAQARAAFALAGAPKAIVNDIMAVTETAPHLIGAFAGRSRAFVQVQNGCDHRCTFCIIPFGRGNSRSVPMGAVVEDVRRLVANGYCEIVLTGVDITSYGADLPGSPRLGVLVKQILKHVPELKRLRLSSIDSVEADRDLLDALANEPRLMPHLHLSLQSGDDLILKRMKRRHLRADAIAFCERVRRLRPDTVFGADLIAGFPTETEAMFERTLDLVDECGLTHLHVFPFSPRPGTPAARMPQLSGGLVKARARRLRERGALALRRHLDGEVGRTRRVLTESRQIARTEQFTRVVLATPGEPGTMADL